jgi:hypothetical protein
MRNARSLAVLLCAALLVLSVASPAIGGPSISSVAQTAKKALRIANSTKTQLRRSYNRTHPTEVVAVDGGERTAPPFGFAEWDITCPRGTVVAGSAIGYGALEPVSDLSYGRGALIALGNPSDSQSFSGSVTINCVWGLGDDAIARASVFDSKREALAVVRKAKADARASVRAVAAKSCGAGYVHAVLPTGHKCLRRGQFCARRFNRIYHRYGFHCKANGHLD